MFFTWWIIYDQISHLSMRESALLAYWHTFRNGLWGHPLKDYYSSIATITSFADHCSQHVLIMTYLRLICLDEHYRYLLTRSWHNGAGHLKVHWKWPGGISDFMEVNPEWTGSGSRSEPEVNQEVNLEVTKHYILLSDRSCQNANQLTHIKQVIFKGFWLSTEIFFQN